MRVRVSHGIGDLAGDLRRIERRTPKAMSRVVRDAAKDGNRRAKAFASEQHTMNSDVDADYPKAFTVEQLGPTDYVYGPDDSLPQGTKATGYEFGSINQASPHQNLDRSFDQVQVDYPEAVDRGLARVWAEAGFQ